MHSAAAPKLYIVGRSDGTGAFLGKVALGMEVAAAAGWNFGGVLVRHVERTSHGFAYGDGAALLFGTSEILVDQRNASDVLDAAAGGGPLDFLLAKARRGVAVARASSSSSSSSSTQRERSDGGTELRRSRKQNLGTYEAVLLVPRGVEPETERS